MAHTAHPVEQYMTPQVRTIGVKHTLADAHQLMNSERIHHLPVIEGGKLVGVVSQTDLHLLESLEGVKPEEVTVDEAMSQDVYVVPPTEPLSVVADELARRRCGSAVVATHGHIQGIFTTTDALHALHDLLEAGTEAKEA